VAGMGRPAAGAAGLGSAMKRSNGFLSRWVKRI
jgi:hypothetical protein